MIDVCRSEIMWDLLSIVFRNFSYIYFRSPSASVRGKVVNMQMKIYKFCERISCGNSINHKTKIGVHDCIPSKLFTKPIVESLTHTHTHTKPATLCGRAASIIRGMLVSFDGLTKWIAIFWLVVEREKEIERERRRIYRHTPAIRFVCANRQ